jgi:predicted TIM-barrel fold metal-dependent hydrolase
MKMTDPTRPTAKDHRFEHPIIDSDGHFVEFFPGFLDYLEREVGPTSTERFQAEWDRTYLSAQWYDQSAEERRDRRSIRPAFWNVPTRNTLDLATAMLPELLYERLDEIGSSFAVMYPGLGLAAIQFHDEEIRRAASRALNRMYADLFRDYSDRMTPVAVIPTHTPKEATEELDFAIGELGLKAVVMPAHVQRPIGAIVRDHPDVRDETLWLDTYGIDSEHDYDPLWAKCLELGVAPSFHSPGMGWGSRRSISSYVYNHIGHFAAASEALCKSLFLGGVTRRFPELRFAFLEGGAGWGTRLLADLISHWKKRNKDAIAAYDPKNLDRERFQELFARHGSKVLGRHELVAGTEMVLAASGSDEDPALLDEFARCEIDDVDDLMGLFVPSFYFGCEADDPLTPWAFDTRRAPGRVALNAVYGSDIGHWDVPDMSKVMDEVVEPLDEGLMSRDDFRAFVFENPVRLHTAANASFFEGTVVEQDVRRLLASES